MGGASTRKDKTITLYLFKRNLHLLGYSLLIHSGSTCLFLRQAGVRDAMFLPETLDVHFCPTAQAFKRKSIIFVSSYTNTSL